eukprot:gene2485-3229_t
MSMPAHNFWQEDIEMDRFLRMKISVAQSTDNLDLSNIGLTELPSELFELNELKELSLAGNYLTHLPEDLGRLTALEKLNIAGNQLHELPQSLVNLTDLEGLWAHGNLLRTLPVGIAALRKLRTLALSGNRLEALEPEIGELVMLESLTLSGNRLRQLPETIGNLSALNEIFLHGNELETIPESFSRLTSLGEAMLQGNRLKALPQDFSALRELWNFSCADNQLEGLPPTLLTRPLLKGCYAYGNNIRRIPTEALPSAPPGTPPLMQLWIEGNPLEPGPLAEALPKLGALRTVGLDESQMAAIPPSALDQVPASIHVSEVVAAKEQEDDVGYFKLSRLMDRLRQREVEDVPRAGMLLIAFGSATGEPNWGRVLKRVRAELAETSPSLPGFDLMYVVDPSRGWYGQDVLCKDACQPGFGAALQECSVAEAAVSNEELGKLYRSRLEHITSKYPRVLMLGESMGASAGLMFSDLATNVVAFCPQVDLSTAPIRPACNERFYSSLQSTLLGAVEATKGKVTVHIGEWGPDREQAKILKNSQVEIVVHPVDSHRVAMALNRYDKLLPLLKSSIVRELEMATIAGARLMST